MRKWALQDSGDINMRFLAHLMSEVNEVCTIQFYVYNAICYLNVLYIVERALTIK